MPWTEITDIKPVKQKTAEIAMGISTNGAGGRFAQTLRFLFRPSALNLTWLQTGETVKVELGTGEDSGFLRITPNGPHTLRSPPTKTSRHASTLKIPAPPRMHPQKRPLEAADYKIAGGGGIVITLPAWCLSHAPAASKPAPAPTGPYKIGAPSHAEVITNRAQQPRK
jgi:hypothetical protein